MIVLRTPKGWTGPAVVDGQQTEGSWRSHQVPLSAVRSNPEHRAQLEAWMRSYRPDELFDERGALRPEIAALAPRGPRRMSANPRANGGEMLRDLRLPDFYNYAVDVPAPGATTSEATRVFGEFLRDIIRDNPETLAAAELLREHLPDLRVRVINVVDLMRLQDDRENPHGLTAAEFDALFTVHKPIVFAYHGYPWLIHRLTYRRANHGNLHVRGYKEEGTTTTPFDIVMLNDVDRFHLVVDVIDRVPGLSARAGHVRQLMLDRRLEARAYTREVGDDLPEIRDWTWSGSMGTSG